MRKRALPILVVMILFTIACTFDIFTISNEDPYFSFTQTADAELYASLTSGKTPEPIAESDVTSEHVDQPALSSSAGSSNLTGDPVEYSVSATDFDCTCQVDGNVTQAIRVEGDQLFLGGVGDEQVYDKISENKYKRSWMGYYISVVDGEEIRVDEEKSTVITLTDTGYVMEHISGTGSSPCCFHTFTQIK